MKAKIYFESKIIAALNGLDERRRKDFLDWKKDATYDFYDSELAFWQACVWEMEELETKSLTLNHLIGSLKFIRENL